MFRLAVKDARSVAWVSRKGERHSLRTEVAMEKEPQLNGECSEYDSVIFALGDCG